MEHLTRPREHLTPSQSDPNHYHRALRCVLRLTALGIMLRSLRYGSAEGMEKTRWGTRPTITNQATEKLCIAGRQIASPRRSCA